MTAATLLAFLSLVALAWAQSRYVTAAVAYANAECRSEKCGNIPDCQCAEFAARAVAAGGCIPGLSSTSSKASYARFMPDGGTWKSYTYVSTTGTFRLPSLSVVTVPLYLLSCSARPSPTSPALLIPVV